MSFTSSQISWSTFYWGSDLINTYHVPVLIWPIGNSQLMEGDKLILNWTNPKSLIQDWDKQTMSFSLTSKMWRNHSLTLSVEGLGSARWSLYSAQHMSELHLRDEGGTKRQNGGTDSDLGGFGLLPGQCCESWWETDRGRRRRKAWVRNTFENKPARYFFAF